MTTKQPKVRISTQNEAAIRAFLAARQKAGQNMNMGVGDVIDAIYIANATLKQLGISRSQATGARFSYAEAGPSAAYKYKREQSRIVLERDARGWSLVGCGRISRHPKEPQMADLVLTKEQAALVERKPDNRAWRWKGAEKVLPVAFRCEFRPTA